MNKCSTIPGSTYANQCMYWYVISHVIRHVRTYPAATQKGVADLCLCQLQCMCILLVLKIFSLCSQLQIRIANKAACVSKHDYQHNDKMNTLAFVNVLLVKIFPILIRQYFPSKCCTIRYQYNRMMAGLKHELLILMKFLCGLEMVRKP